MKYSEWQEGLPAPEGYTVAIYRHCEQCPGHEYLEPDTTQDVHQPQERQIYRGPPRPGMVKSRRYFNDKRGGRL